MAAKVLGFIVLGLAFLMPALGNAAYVDMEHNRIRISGATDYAVLLIVKDFWDKPFFAAAAPVQDGEAIFGFGSAQCKSICKANAVDLTQEEYQAIRQQVQLQRLEALCRQLNRQC